MRSMTLFAFAAAGLRFVGASWCHESFTYCGDNLMSNVGMSHILSLQYL